MILRRAASRLVERISRHIVFKRRMPSKYGRQPVYITPDARLSVLRPSIQKVAGDLFSWADQFVAAGDVVWDVGANLGLFSFSAAYNSGPTGHVFAFEPDLRLAHLLEKSSLQSTCERSAVTVLPLAVAQSAGLMTLNVAKRGRAANHLTSAGGSTQAGGIRYQSSVPTVNLDKILQHISAPSLVKIDAEGAEADILKGGRQLLANVHPTIICEVYARNRNQVADILHYHNYQLCSLDHSSNHPTEIDQPTHNTLALPK